MRHEDEEPVQQPELEVHLASSSFACEGYAGLQYANLASRVLVLREVPQEEVDQQVDRQDRQDHRDQWEVSCGR